MADPITYTDAITQIELARVHARLARETDEPDVKTKHEQHERYYVRVALKLLGS